MLIYTIIFLLEINKESQFNHFNKKNLDKKLKKY